MRTGYWFGIKAVFVFAVIVGMMAVARAEQPSESAHRSGPGGLSGWTLSESIPDHPHELFSKTLVLARNGHVFRQIQGDPFLWTWQFRSGGRQVAYEAGPLHFGMLCFLVDIQTGHKISSYNCYHDLPANAPEWVKELKNADQ